MLKRNCFYKNKDFGVFRVGHISKNGLLVAIYNANNQKKVVVTRNLTDAIPTTKAEYKTEPELYDIPW